jgi:hypothetical protein
MKFFSLVSAMLFGLAAAAPTVDSELAKRVRAFTEIAHCHKR